MGTYVGAVNVADGFDGVSKSALTLFREPMISCEKFTSSTPAIKFGGHSHVSYRRSFVTKHCQLVVDFCVNAAVKIVCPRSCRMIEGCEPVFSLRGMIAIGCRTHPNFDPDR